MKNEACLSLDLGCKYKIKTGVKATRRGNGAKENPKET
jgi:hypothetical protein